MSYVKGARGLVRRWREFVEQVERGYSLGIEDYRNDLDVRGIIALAKADDAGGSCARRAAAQSC